MTTMQSIVNDARKPLNDPELVTWKDAELFGYGLHGLRLLKGKRPDLFFGLSSTVLDSLVIGGTFPLDEFVIPAITDYITARAQFKDDEYAVQGAAAPFYALFKEALA